MDNFKPKIHIAFKGNKCDITVKCPDCGKDLLSYSGVYIKDLKKRKEIIEKTLRGCLHCNLRHEDMCKGVPNKITTAAAIAKLTNY